MVYTFYKLQATLKGPIHEVSISRSLVCTLPQLTFNLKFNYRLYAQMVYQFGTVPFSKGCVLCTLRRQCT